MPIFRTVFRPFSPFSNSPAITKRFAAWNPKKIHESIFVGSMSVHFLIIFNIQFFWRILVLKCRVATVKNTKKVDQKYPRFVWLVRNGTKSNEVFSSPRSTRMLGKHYKLLLAHFRVEHCWENRIIICVLPVHIGLMLPCVWILFQTVTVTRRMTAQGFAVQSVLIFTVGKNVPTLLFLVCVTSRDARARVKHWNSPLHG